MNSTCWSCGNEPPENTTIHDGECVVCRLSERQPEPTRKDELIMDRRKLDPGPRGDVWRRLDRRVQYRNSGENQQRRKDRLATVVIASVGVVVAMFGAACLLAGTLAAGSVAVCVGVAMILGAGVRALVAGAVK